MPRHCHHIRQRYALPPGFCNKSRPQAVAAKITRHAGALRAPLDNGGDRGGGERWPEPLAPQPTKDRTLGDGGGIEPSPQCLRRDVDDRFVDRGTRCRATLLSLAVLEP